MVDRIYETKNRILERIDTAIRDNGIERVDVNEMGMLVDMVKDLAEAEKSCWEAEYYRSVTDAMASPGYGSVSYTRNARSGGRTSTGAAGALTAATTTT